MIIKINNVVLEGIHGYTEAEKKIPQKFRIDVEVRMEKDVKVEDKIENTFDYRIIKKSIYEIIEGEHCDLVETVAEKIADKILENKEGITVSVTVSKISIWENGYPSVTVTCQNPK